MLTENRVVSLVYKIVSALVCFWGIDLTIGITRGGFAPSQLLYYTVQSNLLCLVYFLLSALWVAAAVLRDGIRGPAAMAPRFKGAVVMAITVTMLIYWVLLHDYGFQMDGPGMLTNDHTGTWSNLLVHLVTPLLTIFDWLAFDPKGKFRWTDPLLWEVIPLAYYGLSLIVAQTGVRFHSGSRYPYYFIDSDVIGWGGVAGYVLILMAVFLVIGYLVLLADRLMGKASGKKVKRYRFRF